MQVKDIMSQAVHVSVPGNRRTALNLMREKDISGLPVVKEGTKTLVGVLTRSDLIGNPDEEQIALIMSQKVVTATLDEDVKSVAKKMLENNVRRIPILENDELVGIVTSFDVVASAIAVMDLDGAVENYMIKDIPTTWENTPLNVAFEIMNHSNFKFLISLNNEGKMTGILTETEFINESEVVSERSVHNSSVGTEGDKWSWDSTSVLYVEKNHLKFSDKLVKDVATSNVTTATTKTKVSKCANKMKQKNIEQIPVIGIEEDLVGIIRANDLLNALLD
ncbi:MAG: CBS domain-containing protein [Methanobacteriaceae archaeon]